MKVGITMTIDMELVQNLQKEARNKGITMSALVNSILKEKYK